jgi:prepilin-type N-terminal cleavage/methylation domain-containing protein
MKKIKGNTLIEILVSLALFSMVLLGAEFSFLKSQQYHQAALNITREKLHERGTARPP